MSKKIRQHPKIGGTHVMTSERLNNPLHDQIPSSEVNPFVIAQGRKKIARIPVNYVPPKKWTPAEIEKYCRELLKWFKADENAYFYQEFNVLAGIPNSTIDELSIKNGIIAETIQMCKDVQEIRIATDALKGKVNTNMATLMLKKYNTGYDEKKAAGGLNDEETNVLKNEAKKLMREQT